MIGAYDTGPMDRGVIAPVRIDMNMVDTNNVPEEDITTSSEEEDEEAELITEDVEKGFLKVFSQLKNKDPQIYREDIKYFTNEEEENCKQSSKKKSQKVRDKKNASDANSLDDFWTSKNLNDDEKFLRDYILNKKFLGGDDIDMEEELKKLREEEKELAEEAMFEYKYNNRFEEQPDDEFVKKYPHTLGIVTKQKKNVKETPKEDKHSHGHLEHVDDHKSKKCKKIKSQSNADPSSKQESSYESVNADKSKKVKKKHKENKDPSNLGITEELSKVHCSKNGSQGDTSISRLGESKIREIKELKVVKRKLYDSMEVQSKMDRKNKKSKLVPDIDQNQSHEDRFENTNQNQLKKVKQTKVETESTKDGKNIKISKSTPKSERTQTKLLKTDRSPNFNKSGTAKDNNVKKDKRDSQVGHNGVNELLVKKKRKTKNKDKKKLVKENKALVAVGNVKLKKMLRYKSRRKRHLASNEIKSKDVALKLVQKNRKSVEKIATDNPESAKNLDSVKGKKRKRSRRKPSGGEKDVANNAKGIM